MKRLTLLLLAMVVLSGCGGTESGSPTPTSTEIITPSETPSAKIPTHTPLPTLVPTSEPPPTLVSTPQVTVWGVVEQMFGECGEWADWKNPSAWDAYENQLVYQARSTHPEWAEMERTLYGGVMQSQSEGQKWIWTTHTGTNSENGPHPFVFADLATRGVDDGTPWMGYSCTMYILVYEDVPENSDGDGIIQGSGRLFYEVGGEEPRAFDGELREIGFNFPPVNSQERVTQIFDSESQTCEPPTNEWVNKDNPPVLHEKPMEESPVVFEVMNESTSLKILRGPVCQSGYVWWLVQPEGSNTTGWFWSEPYP